MNKREKYPSNSTLGVFDFRKVAELRPKKKQKPWVSRPKSPIVYVWKTSIPDTWRRVYGESHFKHITQTKQPINTIEFLKETQGYIHNICRNDLRDQASFASSKLHATSPLASKPALKRISLSSRMNSSSSSPRYGRKLIVRSQSQASPLPTSNEILSQIRNFETGGHSLIKTRRSNISIISELPHRCSSVLTLSPGNPSTKILQLDGLNICTSPRTTKDLLSLRQYKKLGGVSR
jgi:hypothetical protein